jgi:hypothetical protein
VKDKKKMKNHGKELDESFDISIEWFLQFVEDSKPTIMPNL